MTLVMYFIILFLLLETQTFTKIYGNNKNLAWAYQNEKWEHLFAKEYLSTPGRLLDIGCGGGDFLKIVEDKATQVTGLETNQIGIQLGRTRQLDIINDTIENHALNFPEYYDTVTLFQVLEHVCYVKEFVLACIAVLKKEGRLVISVPNNESFIQHDPELPLNMPPHHVGLWNRTSLEGLSKFFNITLIRHDFEPLQEMNTAWYQAVMEKNTCRRVEFFGHFTIDCE